MGEFTTKNGDEKYKEISSKGYEMNSEALPTQVRTCLKEKNK